MDAFVVVCIETPAHGPWRVGFISRPRPFEAPMFAPAFAGGRAPMKMDRNLARQVLAVVAAERGRVWFTHPFSRYRRRAVPVYVRMRMNAARRADFNAVILAALDTPAPTGIAIDIWPEQERHEEGL